MLNLSFNKAYTLTVTPHVPRSSDTCIFYGNCAETGQIATIVVSVSGKLFPYSRQLIQIDRFDSTF